MKYLYQNKYWEINKKYNLDKLLYLMIDRPNHINTLNNLIWLNNQYQKHRDYDLPSFISYIDNETCVLYWYINGKQYKK